MGRTPDLSGNGRLILMATQDGIFAEKIGKTLAQWDFRHRRFWSDTEFETQGQEAEVLLLDIRESVEDAIALLRPVRDRFPEIAVVLINKPDHVTASIAGMKAGAANEIIVPFDTDTFRKVIVEACELGQRARRKKNRKSLLTRFSEAMMAATFAEAGEFESALDVLNTEAPRRSGKAASKKKKDRA